MGQNHGYDDKFNAVRISDHKGSRSYLFAILVFSSVGCALVFLFLLPYRSKQDDVPSEQSEKLTQKDLAAYRPEIQSPVLIIGLDGADWTPIRKLIARGKLKTLSHLIKNGVSGPLQSTKPLLSPCIWTSIATGLKRNKHGVLGFLHKPPGSLKAIPITSSARKEAAIWDIFSYFGHTSLIMNYWASFPVIPLKGLQISDRFTYYSGEGTYPSLMEDELKFLQPAQDHTYIRSFFGFDNKQPGSKAISGRENVIFRTEKVTPFLIQDHFLVKMSLYCLKKYPSSLTFLYFRGLDSLCHNFWDYHDPTNKKFKTKRPEDEVTVLNDVINRYYEEYDALTKRILDTFTTTPQVYILSDHGFEASGRRTMFLVTNRLLEKAGLLNYKKDGSIDWARTKVMDFSPSVFDTERFFYINEIGKFEQGIVTPGKEKQDLVTKLYRLFGNARDRRGAPVFQFYGKRFPWAETDADFVAEVVYGIVENLDNQIYWNGELISVSEYFPGHYCPGGHAEQGIFIAHGPGIRANVKIQDATIYDIL
ncbi:alkaline phosphatase family protein, partial [candidate division CSSED10-310 bacterium]